VNVFDLRDTTIQDYRDFIGRHRDPSGQVEDPYVLSTGTGSGKSLAYIVPIVDHILRQGLGQGIKAIIVYPMNALANSQPNDPD
jgi:ATP-dependent helicase YprA (DUF1998 family)